MFGAPLALLPHPGHGDDTDTHLISEEQRSAIKYLVQRLLVSQDLGDGSQIYEITVKPPFPPVQDLHFCRADALGKLERRVHHPRASHDPYSGRWSCCGRRVSYDVHGVCYTDTGCIRADSRGAVTGEWTHPDLLKEEWALLQSKTTTATTTSTGTRRGPLAIITIKLSDTDFAFLKKWGFLPSKMLFLKSAFEHFSAGLDRKVNSEDIRLANDYDCECVRVPIYDQAQYEQATANVNRHNDDAPGR